MGHLFLAHCDKKRYSNLICNVENEYTRGSATYPQTLRAAFAMLINYKATRQQGQEGMEYGSMFYMDDNESSSGYGRSRGCGQGHGNGRDNRGSRSGRHGRGHGNGNECGSGTPKVNEPEDAKELHLMVNDDLEMVNDYSLFHRISHCLQLSERSDLKSNMLLIDSCSTMNLIANPALLHNIHKVDIPLKV